VGQLVTRRQNLVKNHFLQELAAKLDVEDYGLYNSKHHLTQASLRHFSGNCIETILGAILLDGGADEARKLFGRLAFSEVGGHLH
jgi:dsRNA-specific ribonuclease